MLIAHMRSANARRALSEEPRYTRDRADSGPPPADCAPDGSDDADGAGVVAEEAKAETAMAAAEERAGGGGIT